MIQLFTIFNIIHTQLLFTLIVNIVNIKLGARVGFKSFTEPLDTNTTVVERLQYTLCAFTTLHQRIEIDS